MSNTNPTGDFFPRLHDNYINDKILALEQRLTAHMRARELKDIDRVNWLELNPGKLQSVVIDGKGLWILNHRSFSTAREAIDYSIRVLS